MNNNTPAALKPSRASLLARFRAYNRNAKLGAVAMLSLSSLRALSAVEQRQAQHLTRSIVAQGRTDDGETAQTLPESGETFTGRALSVTLSPVERAAIQAARPGSRSVVWRKPVAEDDGDEPLPAGYVPAPQTDEPASVFLPMSPELAAIEAQAASEAAAEVAEVERIDARDAAAVSFRSDYDAAAPIDYAPVVPANVQPVRVSVTLTPPSQQRDALNEHERLLIAILGNAAPRRNTMAAR